MRRERYIIEFVDLKKIITKVFDDKAEAKSFYYRMKAEEKEALNAYRYCQNGSVLVSYNFV